MLLPVTLLLVSFDPAAASAYLKEPASWCDAEGKALWNRSLCGPIVIASPQTREFVTSEGARGTFPPERTLANTAFDWNGRKWTMLLWPLPEDAESRKALFAHELWHRIQADIGFPATGPVNAHLEEAEGRIWMRLEGKALRRALESKGDARRRAVQEALSFRHRRHAIFRSAEAEERALEMHEGLAEYTGVAASGAADRLAPAGLARLENGGGFARTFAYATGPAYGVLLDAHSENWRAGLTPNRSLAALLAAAADVKPGDPFDGAAAYGGGAIRQQELQLERDRIARVARHRKRFVEGPVLELPVAGKFNFSFDPNKQWPVSGLGTVYDTMQATDEWGTLAVSKEALIGARFDRIVVPLPDLDGTSGDGWKLDLAKGWRVVNGKRPGDRLVARVARPGE